MFVLPFSRGFEMALGLFVLGARERHSEERRLVTSRSPRSSSRGQLGSVASSAKSAFALLTPRVNWDALLTNVRVPPKADIVESWRRSAKLEPGLRRVRSIEIRVSLMGREV